MAPKLHTQLFINNEYVDSHSSETLSIYSPHDESLVAEKIQCADQSDVDAAVAAARAAFKGEWSTWSNTQRSQVMLRFADLIDQHVDDLAPWEGKCMGQPLTVTKTVYNILSASFRCA